WNNRPAANHQCTRDITWAPTLKGFADQNKLPYAQLICQHKVGDVVGGKGGSDKKYNGCPVEGKQACEDRLGKNNPDCNKGQNLLTEGVCIGGPNTGIYCGANSECPKGYCDMTGSPCYKTWWDTCDFYEDGPLTTYFRYAPFLGASEPVHMVWGTFSRSVHQAINAAASSLPTPLSSLLPSKKFSAIVSTDKQIVEIDATTVTTKDCTPMHCKFWHIADLDPTSGLINVKNNLLEGREGVTAGVALYEYYFQGTKPPPQKYCVCNNCTPPGAVLKWCDNELDCPVGSCKSISSQDWSHVNF
ncbi:hypothetical protein KKF59_01620, partial [Patescibacteria group bacterium]|nr:hypothetical protein [Patescibacteria group bacterium]